MKPNQKTLEQVAFDQVGQLSAKMSSTAKPILDWTLPATQKQLQSDWVVDAEWARIQQQPLRAKQILYAVALSLVLLLVWAAYAELDEMTRGAGKVIPSQKLQLVQSLDGGVIQEILVQEGSRVQKGDLLLKIDATRSKSSFFENEAQVFALQAEVLRLSALTAKTDLAFPTELIASAPDIINRERLLYQSSLSELNEQNKILRDQLFQRQQALKEALAAQTQHEQGIALLSQELAATRPLLKSGAVSQVELLRLERQLSQLQGDLAQTQAVISRNRGAINEARNKINELSATADQRWRKELAEASSRLNALKQAAKGLKDVVIQTDVRAPITGTVQRLLANTIGGVLTPGQIALEIIPSEDTLIIEAKISPKDIAFIHPGQKATVKFTAYDFSIYGGMEAKVVQISPDSITDENQETYYLVKLRNTSDEFSDKLEILPGMMTQVDILTGKKTVLEYLFKPILRASSEAMRER